ncbi:methylcobalamin:coenzyme M methyltransferase [Oxobacter pfennigii]|uniref:Methylcobalamin:coenzyme M methyltransferase n=1 Tax=Oxobacter pfennigii TaxID=36849 RepID=A0A0P8W9B0_9CLOT|nr:uroporphyrinogen decarboxylase family protein [Oxobacter pfennigii]KPU44269.1 methylcobalamin:coenzyme M methyltransferase [Oxobacter pfennigii]
MAKSKLTPKENFMRVVNGEMPEYVPHWTMGFPAYNDEPVFKMVGPNIWGRPAMPGPEGRYDIWGVHYVANEETGYGGIPEPNNFILDDITKWHEVIKAPKSLDANEIDWEQQAKKDIEESKIDLTQSAAMVTIPLMPFQQLIAFMGFTNGLCALYEDPETCKELLNFLADYYVPFIDKSIEYYKPDMVYLLDDTAAKMNPFISLEMYRDIFKPIYSRLTKTAVDRGIPVEYHNCGRCEDFMEDAYEFGVRVWDPVQTSNDILATKEKFKGRIAIAGCYDWKVPDTWPEVNEEEVRQTVRDMIDKYAPGGGFAGGANCLGKLDDPVVKQVNQWLSSEVYLYGRDYYIK